MSAMNYAIVIIGLLAIGLFWNAICPADRKKEMKVVSVVMLVLGTVVYYLQSTYT